MTPLEREAYMRQRIRKILVQLPPDKQTPDHLGKALTVLQAAIPWAIEKTPTGGNQ